VTVSAHRDDVPGQVVVAVTDDGCGLPSDQRAAATRRFWRAPAHQNATGSGLGLAIVDELVTTAGGSVELRDAGPGLAVVITLPAARSGPRWNAEK
jgi:signal transduction histidine kinase